MWAGVTLALLRCLSPTTAHRSCRNPPRHVPRLPNLTQFLVSPVVGYPMCVPGKEIHPGTWGYRERRVSLGAEMTRVYQ